jgi:ankyrin repeat protein
MIKPRALETEKPHGPWSCRGSDVWETLRAARDGDIRALGDLLARDPHLHKAEFWYTQPIHFAVREGHLDAVLVLLEAGADPGWVGLSGDSLVTVARDRGHEPMARLLESRTGAPMEGGTGKAEPSAAAARGAALHGAARTGNLALVERLLADGADPNATIDSAGSATYAAATPEIRAVLVAHGGKLDPYDLVFLGENEEALRRVSENLDSASLGCGGVLAAACTLGKKDLVVRLLEAGVRVPPVLTECRSYLWSEPDLLRLLLASGMSPDLPNWLHATPLHSLCQRDARGRPRAHRRECAEIFLDAGATLSARDEDYRSTPLGWAARSGLADMVEWLLERGAPARLPDDEEWATPLAWARRRGHDEIVARLLRAGAEE